MDKITYHKWIEADDFANLISANYKEDIWAYLKSGQSHDVKNSKSLIALFAIDEITDQDVDYLIKNKIKNNYGENYEDNYLSLLSYEYRHNIESKYLKSDNSFIDFPSSIFVKFAVICEFDHDLQKLNIYYKNQKYLDKIHDFLNKDSKDSNKNDQKLKITNLNSNFSRDQYYQGILAIKDQISKGICYQSNLTRKFFGNFEKELSNATSFDLFRKLSNDSPANYSSFIKYYDKTIISNSPELYLKLDNDIVTSKPIKGTSPRSNNPIIDFCNKKYLTLSTKEKAENLMIVDLVRNDLSSPCVPGSVSVDDLFKVDSYKSYHHLSSTITSKLRNDRNLSDVIKNSFPPASMTGTPKISATNVALELEGFQRGIYSGTIGFINGKKDANLSVVIRTLIIENNRFEFQVGGAITIDSKPNKEIEETFVKARGICKILGIKNLEHIQPIDFTSKDPSQDNY